MLNYVIVANKPGTIVEIHRNQKISVQKLLGNFKLSHACCQSISNTPLRIHSYNALFAKGNTKLGCGTVECNSHSECLLYNCQEIKRIESNAI